MTGGSVYGCVFTGGAENRLFSFAELAEVLRKFKPTKIGVEHGSQERQHARYEKYLAGDYVLTANEIDQIGLRLAKELGHTTIYAVDADGDFPFQRVVNYAKATGQSAKLDAIVNTVEKYVQESPERERPTSKIGEMIMRRLKELDKVAYVRFASVYLEFEDVSEFMTELKHLVRTRATGPGSRKA